MPSSLVLAAHVGMVLSGLAMVWLAWHNRLARSFMFVGTGSILGGLAGFLRSDSAQALFAVAAAAFSIAGLVLLIRATLRSAKSAHAQPGGDE